MANSTNITSFCFSHRTIVSVLLVAFVQLTFSTVILKRALLEDEFRLDVPKLDIEETVQRYQGSGKKVLLLDYDGTLAEFHSKPDMAVPSPALKEVLGMLNQDRNTHVAIISGRDRSFLEKHFGHYSTFLLSAEHGAFEKAPGEREWTDIINSLGTGAGWKEKVKNIMEKAKERSGLGKIEMKETGVVFHYRETPPSDMHKATQLVSELIGELNEDQGLRQLALIVEHDALAVDVRPLQLTKGNIVQSFWRKHSDAQLVLCLGDGATDEAMFKALHAMEKAEPASPSVLYTIHVENDDPKPTRAKYKINDVQAVVDLLRLSNQLPKKSVKLAYEPFATASLGRNALEKTRSFREEVVHS